ncbi:MAG: cyclic pyranopterin monophosphate synthase MoaC [Archaeoglobaceae archaeon]
MEFSHIKGERSRAVDISHKEDSVRVAVAEGVIYLRNETIEAIKGDKIAKGNVLAVANTAAIMAVKKTPELIPMCHPIPLTSIEVEFDFEEFHGGREGIRATCTVKSVGKTGVEMEALTGASTALLTVWDMVKSIEKDDTGNYPETAISDVRVVKKKKQEMKKD